jgi:aminoglycoside phosphotransferase (APT) family kinase protein
MSQTNTELAPYPSTASIAKAIRYELRTWIAPEVKDERSKTVLGMIENLLLDIVVREEKLQDRLRTQLEEQKIALEDLTREGGASVGLTSAVALKQEPSRQEILAAEAQIVSALEQQIARTIVELRTLPASARGATSEAIRRALLSEKARIEGLTSDKADFATRKGHRADDDRIMERDRLTAYLRQRMPGTVEVTAVKKMFGGFSKETFIVDLGGSGEPLKSIVIRKDVDGGPVEGSAVDELPLLQALRDQGIPVPRPLWAETDASIFGHPFIVVECCPGSVAANINSSVSDKNGILNAKLMAKVLAQIHRIDLTKFPVISAQDARAPLKTHVERLIDGFISQWHRRRVDPSAIMTAALAWMRANIPATTPRPTLVHGDASLRNMLVHENKLSALIDWELWHIGDPNEDLASVKPDIEQVMSWKDFLNEYYAHGGLPYDERTGRFYEMFVPVRNAVTSANMTHDFQRRKEPDDLRGFFTYGYFYPAILTATADRLLAFEDFAAWTADGSSPDSGDNGKSRA